MNAWCVGAALLLELQGALEFQCRVGGEVCQAKLNSGIHRERCLRRADDSIVVVVAISLVIVILVISATRVKEQGGADTVLLIVERTSVG